MQAAELEQIAIERALASALGGATLSKWPTWEEAKREKPLNKGMQMLRAQALKDN
jgi:hypothetical protein